MILLMLHWIHCVAIILHYILIVCYIVELKYILSYRYGYSQSSGTSVIPVFKKSTES